MAKGRLSNRSIEAFACPPGREQDFLWDDKLTGYGICARPSGKKTFVVSTRRAGRIAIGRYGPLNEKMAREEAVKTLGLLASGRKSLRSAARNAPGAHSRRLPAISCATHRRSKNAAPSRIMSSP
jgi:hypothetical protein